MLKKLISIFLIISIIFTFSSFQVYANSKENPVYTSNNNLVLKVSSTDFSTNERKSISFNTENIKRETTIISNNVYAETCECIFEIDKYNNVNIVASLPSVSQRSSQESSEENVYWKAKIKIIFSQSGDTVNLTKVEGSWTQLRGTSTIVYRDVTYGQVFFANNNKSGQKTPTTNSFSYNTGFSAGRVIHDKSYIGAFSQMKYCRQFSTTESSLEVQCDKYF